MIVALKRAVFPARFLLNLARGHDMVLVEGEERAGGLPLRVLCPDTAGVKDYLLRRLFREGARERRLGRLPSWAGAERARALAPEADLLFWYVRPALAGLAREGALARLPAWVPVHVDLKSPECLARGKEKLTRSGNALRKAGFVLDITRAEADFEDFHARAFLPYVRSRHGENAVAQTLAETMAGRRRGWELLALRRDGVIAAGATMEFSGGRARFWQMGVRDGDPKLLAEGVSDFVYHHMLSTCRVRGVGVLHLGSCRPFAQDGVLEYKRRFGAYVAQGESAGRGFIDLHLLRPSAAALDCLAANPVISLETDGSHRLRAFARGTADEMRAAEEKWRDRYCFGGGPRLTAVTLPAAS